MTTLANHAAECIQPLNKASLVIKGIENWKGAVWLERALMLGNRTLFLCPY